MLKVAVQRREESVRFTYRNKATTFLTCRSKCKSPVGIIENVNVRERCLGSGLDAFLGVV